MDGQEKESVTATPETAESPKNVSLKWVWILLSVWGVAILAEIAEALGWLGWMSEWPVVVRRIFDVFLYLVAGGLGLALSHWLTKRSMAITNAKLQQVVGESLRELEMKLPKESSKGQGAPSPLSRSSTLPGTSSHDTSAQNAPLEKDSSSENQIPLPIPFIVEKLGDMNSKSFGYFGGKLVSRDPRLLLDLSLDTSRTTREGDEIWKLKQRIMEANTKATLDPSKSKPGSHTPPQETTQEKSLDNKQATPDQAKTGRQTLAQSIDIVVKALVHMISLLKMLQAKKEANEPATSETGPSAPNNESEEGKK